MRTPAPSRTTTVSGVDVQPDFCVAANVADVANGIDACIDVVPTVATTAIG